MVSSVAVDNDFVFTLSDDDDEILHASSPGRDSSEDDLRAENADKKKMTMKQKKEKKKKKEKKRNNNNKRKRQDEAVSGDEEEEEEEEMMMGKKRKKSQGEHPNIDRRRSQQLQWPSEESSCGETGEKEDDDALDPGFEFEIPGLSNGGLVEEFDAWGGDADPAKTAPTTTAQKRKQAVDLDEIIGRRRARRSENKEEAVNGDPVDGMSENAVDELKGEQEREDGGYEEEAGQEEEEEEAFPTFEDDELLATDGFGAGTMDQEDDEVEEAGDGDSVGEHYQNGDIDAGLETEDESVASPTAHPDDAAHSGTDSDTSVEDPEEASKRAAFFAPEVEEHSTSKTGSGSTNLSSSFQNFSLSRPILKGLSTLSFTTPTPIQQKTIPVALLGKDVVGSAVTGSGKTAAFLLPILERLLYRPRKVPTTRVAILMPTRELAVQCYAVAIKLATFTDITFGQLVGGFPLREQEAVLKRRPDVVIATPGRFIDHMRNSASFTIDTLEILVLDEADRMLEDGFSDELNEIVASIPKSRQTMLFSATMTESVDKLIRVGLNRPVRLMVNKQKSTVDTLTQEFVRLRPGREDKRLGCLLYLCKNVHTARTIIFFRQKKDAHRVRIIFSLLDLKAGELHGSMTQEQRINAVETFRSGKTQFLLATDLASRGLDIKGVETIINYEAPQSHDIYLHRVGRTARAGKTGRACTLAAEPDRKVVKAAVKAARNQGAKIVSRVIEARDADSWAQKALDLEGEVEEVLKEEKEERQLAQVDQQVSRAENLVQHREEILARPRRTWFESEKEKRIAKLKLKRQHQQRDAGANVSAEGKAKAKADGDVVVGGARVSWKGGKLSGKDRKRLDDHRERLESGGKSVWKKGKRSEEAARRDRLDERRKKIKRKDSMAKASDALTAGNAGPTKTKAKGGRPAKKKPAMLKGRGKGKNKIK